jgi:hypothetical protein
MGFLIDRKAVNLSPSSMPIFRRECKIQTGENRVKTL